MEEFLFICKHENTNKVKEFYRKYKNIYRPEITQILKYIIKNKEDRNEIVYMILFDVDNLTKEEYTELFNLACMYGKKEIMKMLYELYILDAKTMENIFVYMCGANNFDMIQYLYILCPYLDDIKTHERAFIVSCKNGNLSLSKWLYHNEPTMNIKKIIPLIYYDICLARYFEMSEWLHSLALNSGLVYSRNTQFIEM